MKQLDTVVQEKDLGIVITKDLKVSQQCKQASISIISIIRQLYKYSY